MSRRRTQWWSWLLLAVGLVSCTVGPDRSTESQSATSTDLPETARPTSLEWFTDQADATGLRFVHFNGMSGGFYQPEIMGPGVGLLDYDNDGDLDVYLVQGELLDDGVPIIPLPNDQQPGDRLFRNDLDLSPEGTPHLLFTDVTEESGLAAARGYGIGVASGDYDNDGWVDVYITRFGANQLFRNQGDGTFADVSAQSGTDDAAWGVPASFIDYDRDGWLDLFVGNYLNYTIESHIQCYFRSGPPDYCPPEVSPAQPDLLFRNLGNGTFEDVTLSAGLGRDFGPALGAASADFNNDGWIDFFVANDQRENQLWINQQNGRFDNLALLGGVALGITGEAKADMGVDAGDFDNDGDEDLFITELTGQGSTMYVNDGRGLFDEQSAPLGIRGPSLPNTGFGTAWLDVNNDGWLDLLAVNGFVTQRLDELGTDDPFPLSAPNQLFLNRDGREFEDVTDQAGAVLALQEVSRGAAVGDVDNDGDTDALIGNAAGPVRLLINTIGQDAHWIGLRLVGAEPARDMLGARVEVILSDGSTRWRRARADGSYASANDPRVLVGLGDATSIDRIRITWPNGQVETWTDVEIDQYTTLHQGNSQLGS